MIIILEGANGAGKTTYAKALAKKHKLTVYRAFRQGREKHDDSWLTELHQLGVQANRYVEDLFLADFLQSFPVGAVLDRSLPSALIYDQVFKQGSVPKGAGERLLEIWQGSLLASRQEVLYIWLYAPHEVGVKRSSGIRLTRNQWEMLNRRFARLFAKSVFRKMKLDTSRVEVEKGLRRISELAEGGYGS